MITSCGAKCRQLAEGTDGGGAIICGAVSVFTVAMIALLVVGILGALGKLPLAPGGGNAMIIGGAVGLIAMTGALLNPLFLKHCRKDPRL